MKDRFNRAKEWVKSNPDQVVASALAAVCAAQIVFLGHTALVNQKNMSQLRKNSKNFKEAVERGVDFIAKPDGSIHVVNPK